MTDARDAEAAARELVIGLKVGFREGYVSAWVMSGALDAYRDAIEKRVREERDAEVRALEAQLNDVANQSTGDVEGDHIEADSALLGFVNDAGVLGAWSKIRKWYA